jgi:hypothetical protein
VEDAENYIISNFVICTLQQIMPVIIQRFPKCGACPLGGAWALVDRMKHIFILNEIWAQDKIYILIATLLG